MLSIAVFMLGMVSCESRLSITQHDSSNILVPESPGGASIAQMPPMGWVSSERFGCNTDCVNYPDDCISEHLVKTTVDAIHNGRLQPAGYEYVILGDCWQNATRDAAGNLNPDPKRFPTGMKALGDYVHQRGLKLGLFMDVSNATCNGFPGSQGFYERDAQTLAAWGVDFVQASACHLKDKEAYDTAYPALGSALSGAGRDTVYGCEWPCDLIKGGHPVNFTRIGEVCHLYRTHQPMIDSWDSLEEAVKYFAGMARQQVNFSGPGHWHDPGPLLVGNFGLSGNQERIQLATWSVMSAPMLVSADFRHLPPEALDLLLGKATLSIARDPLLDVGYEITLKGQVHVWKKAIRPAGSFALVLMYFNISGGPTKVSIKLEDLGFTTAAAYNMTEVFSGHSMGIYKPWYTLNCEVEPTGVLFINAQAIP